MLLGFCRVEPDEARHLIRLYNQSRKNAHLQIPSLINSNDCVEVGRGIGVRDSKAPTTHLPVSADAWSAFLGLVRGASR